jgi:hypothetical protein
MTNITKNYQELSKEDLEKQKLINDLNNQNRKWKSQLWIPVLANVFIAVIAGLIAYKSRFFEIQSKLIEIKNFKLEQEQDSLTKAKKRIQDTIDFKNSQLLSINDSLKKSHDSLIIMYSIANQRKDSITMLSYYNSNYKSNEKITQHTIDSLRIVVKNSKIKTKGEIKSEVSILIQDINSLKMLLENMVKFYNSVYNIKTSEDTYNYFLTEFYSRYFYSKAIRYRMEIASALNDSSYTMMEDHFYHPVFTDRSIYFIINDLEENVNKIHD